MWGVGTEALRRLPPPLMSRAVRGAGRRGPGSLPRGAPLTPGATQGRSRPLGPSRGLGTARTQRVSGFPVLS